MTKRIKNQKEYEKAIDFFKENLWKQFLKEKADAIDKKMLIIRTTNIFDSRMNLLGIQFKIGQAVTFIQDWIYNNNSKKSAKSDYEILKLFCEENKIDLNDLVLAKAEYVAIQNTRSKILNQHKKIEPIKIDNKIYLNNNVLTKTDFIRIINALYEMKAFVSKENQVPPKKFVMAEFGKSVGIELNNYEKDLSKAVNTTGTEINTKIFEKMKKTMEDYIEKNIRKRR